MLELNKIYSMNCLEGLKQLPDNSINCCVTSPPYWGLRDYGVEGQLGLESTPEEYVAKMVEIFREVRRVLRKDGTLWLNLGDSYYNYRPGKGQALVKQTVSKTKQDLPDAYPRRGNKLVGLKEKDLVGIPWMVAFALRADGWYLRQDIIWHKPNPMPESVTDRCTKSHEYIFLLAKSAQYYYDNEAIKETAKNANKTISLGEKSFSKRQSKGVGVEPSGNGKSDNYTVKEYRNKRSVWTVTTKPFKEAHFATFPPDLIKPCILAGCPKNGVVLDPFMGSGTTGMVAAMYQRNFIGFELNPEYCKMAEKRIEPYLV
jgi:DNA modification methylase